MPDSPDWHEAKPGPGCTQEQLRFWTIREIGKLQETSRLAGPHIHGLRKEIADLDATKAETGPVAAELDRLRQDVTGEFAKVRLELGKGELENVAGRLADHLKVLGEQTQVAFQQVSTVEAQLQAHVSHGFAGAVVALQVLEKQTSARFTQIEEQIVKVQAVASQRH